MLGLQQQCESTDASLCHQQHTKERLFKLTPLTKLAKNTALIHLPPSLLSLSTLYSHVHASFLSVSCSQSSEDRSCSLQRFALSQWRQFKCNKVKYVASCCRNTTIIALQNFSIQWLLMASSDNNWPKLQHWEILEGLNIPCFKDIWNLNRWEWKTTL